MREQRLAGFFAAPARLGANFTVRHFFTVLFALRAAAVASLYAGAQLCACQLEVSPSEAGDDPRSGQTHVGAIVAIADTSDQVRNVLFGEAGIGARVARLSA